MGNEPGYRWGLDTFSTSIPTPTLVVEIGLSEDQLALEACAWLTHSSVQLVLTMNIYRQQAEILIRRRK